MLVPGRLAVLAVRAVLPRTLVQVLLLLALLRVVRHAAVVLAAERISRLRMRLEEVRTIPVLVRTALGEVLMILPAAIAAALASAVLALALAFALGHPGKFLLHGLILLLELFDDALQAGDVLLRLREVDGGHLRLQLELHLDHDG